MSHPRRRSIPQMVRASDDCAIPCIQTQTAPYCERPNRRNRMKRISVLIFAACAAFTLVLSDLADARRMGGGGSIGAQRQSVMPSRPAPAPTAPTGNTATQAQPSAPAAAASKAPNAATPAPAPSGASRWLGPIAGIAAGLGLAALLSHFGLSEGFGSLLLLGLLAVGGFVLLRMFLARRQAATPMPYAGA